MDQEYYVAVEEFKAQYMANKLTALIESEKYPSKSIAALMFGIMYADDLEEKGLVRKISQIALNGTCGPMIGTGRTLSEFVTLK